MNKIWIVSLSTTLIFSCANQPTPKPKPDGQWILSKQKMASAKNNTDLKDVDWKRKFEIAKKACQEKALNAPIPKPNCTSQAPVVNCRPMGKTITSSVCFKPLVVETCEPNSVRDYRKARFEKLESCMNSSGWEYQPFNSQPQPLQPIIDSIPELAKWQKYDWEKWKQVVTIDAELTALPEYKDMPPQERLLIVVEKVKMSQ